MPDLISVIVTTYKREEALDAVLRSLSRQSDPNFEVIVADDGSGPETAALIERWRGAQSPRLAHVWHEDEGFRAAEIRNRAVLASRGDYCVFLDGDCITRPNFVAAHRRLAERGWFVGGNRVLLSQQETARVLRERDEPERWGWLRWFGARMRGRVNRLAALPTVPVGPLRKLRSRGWTGVRSCNLAVWRTDLDRVDGFDADYAGWGKEDSDIVVRLLHAGVRRKDGNFAVGVIHLWHAAADRAQLGANEGRLGEAMTERRIRAHRGLSALAQATNRASA